MVVSSEKTDFVVIDDESFREGPQAVAVGLCEMLPFTQWTKLAVIGSG